MTPRQQIEQLIEDSKVRPKQFQGGYDLSRFGLEGLIVYTAFPETWTEQQVADCRAGLIEKQYQAYKCDRQIKEFVVVSGDRAYDDRESALEAAVRYQDGRFQR